MTLDFSKAELTMLMHAVNTKIVLIMNELVHTDDRSYREYLRQTLTTLEQCQKKLGAFVPIPNLEHATIP